MGKQKSQGDTEPTGHEIVGTSVGVDLSEWETGLAERQVRMAQTLRTLAANASDTDPMRGLADLAERWETVPAVPSQVTALMRDVEEARAELASRLPARPLLASRRVSAALERVQAGHTFEDVVRLAPAELCWAGDFDRVLLSRIEGSSWQPAAWHASGGGETWSAETVAFGEFVQGADIALNSAMIEAEVIRRRRSVLVADATADARTLPALVAIGRCTSYVIAPVVAGDRVVGLLHADAQPSGRSLGECDRVTLRAFADGLGLVMERLALMDTIASQRTQIAEALAAAGRAVEALSAAPVTLDVTVAPEEQAPESNPASPLDHLLTAREREVFAVLVSGATNAEIADQLTVSETTVKSHVKHILRKLRATNRAEAIARYLAASSNNVRSAR